MTSSWVTLNDIDTVGRYLTKTKHDKARTAYVDLFKSLLRNILSAMNRLYRIVFPHAIEHSGQLSDILFFRLSLDGARLVKITANCALPASVLFSIYSPLLGWTQGFCFVILYWKRCCDTSRTSRVRIKSRRILQNPLQGRQYCL